MSSVTANYVRNARAATDSRLSRHWLLVASLLYAIGLTLTITTRSLSTDEAFSAYIADHWTVRTLVNTLRQGDSSDLQMVMHYLYLHFWVSCFGPSEYALRSSNIPFIFLFVSALVWGSWRVFESQYSWIGAAFFPFLWQYASEARPYLTLLSLSAVCMACVLAYLQAPTTQERRWLPRIALWAVLLGATFHMLMLLAVLPTIVLLLVSSRLQPNPRFWRDWKPALQLFAVPYCLLLGYIAWTFLRGTAYSYQDPSLLSMGSLGYRFLGIVGFGPNRHYDISFGPYLLAISLSGFLLLASLAGMTILGLRRGNQRLLLSLLAACLTSALLAVVVSLAVHQQIELRHLAALAPFLLFFIAGCLSERDRAPRSAIALGSLTLITCIWLVASCRLLFLPENQWEDFRGAVDQAVVSSKAAHASIALVADPAAGAYYGLDLTGKAPCFPLVDACSSAFEKVGWPRRGSALYGVGLTSPEIAAWWSAQEKEHKPIVVIISRARHPMYKDSPWWTFINRRKYELRNVHGFFVCLFH